MALCFTLGVTLLLGSRTVMAAAVGDAAAQDYAAGDYATAATKFRELAASAPSSGAFHNLGNAEWNHGRIGRAILDWERAQWLDAFNTNAAINLRFARHTAQLEAPRLAWFEVASTWLPVNAWPVIASLSFWLALAALLLPTIFHWQKRSSHQALAAASFAIFLATLPALIGIQTRGQLGIVLADKTPLRLTPTREGQSTTLLRAGETTRVERERGNYLFVRSDNEVAGWVEKDRLGLIAGP